jgi:glucose-6-phosphate 1-dehydrogenase
VLIEKPFGHDVTSAQQLIDLLGQYFDESQLYRIDHYLAKDTVQNILHFRFHNPLVRDIWKSAYIDHVQITAAESIGIEGRVNFYEQTGAVRDFIQSHMLQLVALTAMEDPQDLSAQSVRRAREQILRNLRPINLTGSEAVRGQYLSYREEVGKPGSVIETFAAIKVIVDTDRWHDTPIYVRTGKQLAAKLTEINLVYSDEPKEHTTNILTVRIQPNEGIAVKLIAKKPGLTHETEEILMDYCYALDARRIRHEAYEKLLLDAMNGDQTLFPSATEIMTNWRYVEPLLAQWHAADEGLFHYKSDSWGPPASDGLLADEHIGWINDERGICQVRFDQTG